MADPREEVASLTAERLVTITTSTLKVYLRSAYTNGLMPDEDQWRTLTVRFPKAHYDFAQAVLQRVTDMEGRRLQGQMTLNVDGRSPARPSRSGRVD